jgi:hypothetical protein
MGRPRRTRRRVRPIGWIDPRACNDDGEVLPPQGLAASDGILAWPERFPGARIKQCEYELGAQKRRLGTGQSAVPARAARSENAPRRPVRAPGGIAVSDPVHEPVDRKNVQRTPGEADIWPRICEVKSVPAPRCHRPTQRRQRRAACEPCPRCLGYHTPRHVPDFPASPFAAMSP